MKTVFDARAGVVTGVLALTGLSGCVGPGDPGACQGADCPLLAGEPVIVASPPSDVVVLRLSLAQSSDGDLVAAGWSELYDQERLYAATSADAGETFGDAVQVDAPADVELSYLRLLAPDGAGLLAGAVAHFPDPMVSSPHSRPRIYGSADMGGSFAQVSDLESAVGDRSFTHGAFSASADGKTLLWAWVDITPVEWLGLDAAPTESVLASVSTDSGQTFSAPQVVSATPFLYAARVTAFVRDGRAGLVYAEARDVPGQPADVGVPVLAMAGADGTFGGPITIVPDEYAAVPAGATVGATGAPPAAALGADGSIHVAWWSTMTIGLWYAVSHDGATFSEPVRVMATVTPTPGDVRVAVDGSGAAWIAAFDQDGVRVVQIPPGEDPIEIEDAAAPLGGTADAFDIVGLPDRGALQLWAGASDGGALPIHLRRIGP
jgi:hypothetical protein